MKILYFLVSLFFISSCLPTTTGTRIPRQACKIDTDCPSNSPICVNSSYCVECTQTDLTNCESGETCVNYTCKPNGEQTTETDCTVETQSEDCIGDTPYCHNGSCVQCTPPDDGCFDNQFCNQNNECENYSVGGDKTLLTACSPNSLTTTYSCKYDGGAQTYVCFCLHSNTTNNVYVIRENYSCDSTKDNACRDQYECTSNLCKPIEITYTINSDCNNIGETTSACQYAGGGNTFNCVCTSIGNEKKWKSICGSSGSCFQDSDCSGINGCGTCNTSSNTCYKPGHYG